ncbi:MAG TPA: glutathione transferase [Anaeromyxobacteraceae bacterium]|nr:glutathione transferase [Anaeromyxobacteraceae bacterium]
MPTDLTLYGNASWSSPYVFSAFVALTEKGLPFEVKLLDLAAREHERPEYRDPSITGRVPALRHGDFWLAESSAIGEYLEDAFPPPQHPRLYPADAKERARVRMVQALVRSDFTAVRSERPTSSVFGGEPVKPLTPAGQAAAERLLRIAAALVPGKSGFVASHFTPADADLALMLMRLVANGDPVPAPLAAWARAIWARPSIQAWLAHGKARR